MHKITTWQNNCDHFSKQCTVLLGFVIPISTVATNVVLLCLLASWFLAGNLKEKAYLIVNHPVARITFVLFGAFLMGTLYSEAPRADMMSMLGKMGKLLYLPFLLPILQEDKWRRAVLLAFLSAMILTLGLSILKVYAGLPISNRFSHASIFRNHIDTNLMMAFASFVIGHYALSVPPNLKRVLLLCVVAGLVFYILFMSEGRSGYVVFAVLALLFGLQRLRLKGLLISIVGLGVILGLAYFNSRPLQQGLSLAITNMEQYTSGNSNTSVGARLEFANQTWQLVKQHPWFGYGTGSFSSVYQNHAATHQLVETRNPHNEYLNILFQLGFFGLAVLIGFFFLLLKWSFTLPLTEKWFAQGGILAIMTGSFANSWLMDFTSGYFFVIIMAVCFGALHLQKGFSHE